MNLRPPKRWLPIAAGAALLAAAPAAPQTTQTAPQNPPADKQETTAPMLAPLPKGKKLILKDGSFLIVSSYEVSGDRVRFYSVERSDWEFIPSAMIDWDATRKEEAEQKERDQKLVAQIKASEAAEKSELVDVDASVLVSEGVYLPPGEGVFVVDGKTVLPLEQAEANTKTNKGRVLEQVLVPFPLIPGKQSVQIAGRRASFRLKNPQPEFYMRTADRRDPDIVLIPAVVKGNTRQLENIRTLLGQSEEQRNTLSMQKWEVAKGVYRFTLGQTLAPGEYVFAEIMPDKGMDLYVWDFGVDSAGKAATPAKKK